VLGVVAAADALGWRLAGCVASPLPGPSGNVEYFVWLRRDAEPGDPAALVSEAVALGPS
jgi:23S rRNA (cytidine1920-2'-O)/16S rRNA (cytidine1409-2'-O)-methyltransferase